ncbi:TIGR04076 family protein [Chloroflexota bacterium]
MADRYKVVAKVISQEGYCAHNQKVGDEWILYGTAPSGICLNALHSIYPASSVLELGGSFPWEDNPEITTITCPDPKNPVVFELRRLCSE